MQLMELNLSIMTAVKNDSDFNKEEFGPLFWLSMYTLKYSGRLKSGRPKTRLVRKPDAIFPRLSEKTSLNWTFWCCLTQPLC